MPVAQHLNPVRVLQLVEDTLPDNSILVVDGGDFVGTAAYLVQPRGPLRWLDPGKGRPTPGAACTPLGLFTPALGSPRGLWDSGGWCRICTWGQTVSAGCGGESECAGCGRLAAFWAVSQPNHPWYPPQVWCLFGDGAFGYSLIEFDTFVRHKVTGRAGLREAQSLGFWEISSGVDWGGSSLSGRGPVPASHLPLAKPWD